MSSEILTPVLPESVADATVVAWSKKPGDAVKQDEVLVEIETDKVVLEVPAPVDGVLTEILQDAGATVTSGQLLGRLEAGAVAAKPAEETAPAPQAETPAASVAEAQTAPAVRKMMAENDLAASDVQGSGKQGRILKEDVQAAVAKPAAPAPVAAAPAPAVAVAASGSRMEQRVPMTRLRARIAERLLHAKSSTAMLTTFNEIDMKPLMDMRNEYKDTFEKKHKAKLGFMSLFVKAAAVALQRFPEINASIDGNDIVYHGYCDVGIAVSSDRGLVVPILRNAENMGLADIESGIAGYAAKAREGKLDMNDLSGGTFTITNGGVFGSLLSTPILNPPQSAILGMHSIQKRPVVVNDQIVIRPMMYVALSYDHRIVDGQGAVTFLKTIKELVENPVRLVLDV
ncbi:2-oxoglutarate dehydrogenase complex dihydrolipoyllysine-residue succinyltransferase [Candidatus Thiothrix sp. Deng01]|uniref:Dihydrolipoyllysine-residue succinyltransferase component of 2-oxoglutarate dehydrogenase complex n=1 Tax=Candidatus Thiothrix phosphatis TaxID=3112415 RepID=A0ABU6CU88_9GAMM|nr:2-oxoglutarate dehydrogenase complex dihydrolipoyllysine-residue succinyltransferase [Candidatus Thiothrix sp. Deng01]MEB4589642.1 2-oxoglutarate dehydrogenase complex dihydrolipoyllysine-residue succinyltransferase [Candidatus Thiothrix sp. Deng01]